MHFYELLCYNDYRQLKQKKTEGAGMELRDYGNGVDSWKEVTLIYNAALRQMETKMEILNDEFQHVPSVQSHRAH